jgi:hypothetical protein
MFRIHCLPIGCALLWSIGCSSSSNHVASTAGSGGADTGGTFNTCPAGSERCACYGNNTCDQGLECRSNLCVSASTSIGGSTGAGGSNSGGTTSATSIGTGGTSSLAGSTSTGGTAAAGGSVAAGGTSSVGGTKNTGGVTSAGGTKTTGGNTSTGGSQSAGGTTGAGGATCGDTTSDWQNCGACGHVCANQGQGCGTKCCVAGQCAPWFGPCFDASSGFKTCADACTSIGAVCRAGGCNGQYTWYGWGALTESNCPNLIGAGATSTASCNSALPYSGESSTVRCCCGET